MKSSKKQLKDLSKQWKSLPADDEVTHIAEWMESLENVLREHGDDQEFIADVIMAASEFHHLILSDDERGVAFMYLLGRYIRSLKDLQKPMTAGSDNKL